MLPLAQTFAALDARIGALPVTKWRAEPKFDRTFEFDANWALYVENYLEGLHIPFIHPGLNAKLDWKSYRYESFANGTLQVGDSRCKDELAFELRPRSSRSRSEMVSASPPSTSGSSPT